MANLGVKNGFCEGQSTSRPPYFDGSNYTYSKARTKIYLQSIDYPLWLNVNKGHYIPINIVNNIEELKMEDEFDEHDMKKCSFNASVINCLYCALNNDEFNRVSMCSSAYENWKTLKVTHEGTNQVKEKLLK